MQILPTELNEELKGGAPRVGLGHQSGLCPTSDMIEFCLLFALL